jgi:predicted RNase H-like nuclease (RuvC/YqgF family)
MDKKELKAAGERLVARHNQRVGEIAPLLQEQEDSKLLGEAAIKAAEGVAEFSANKSRLEKEVEALRKERAELEASAPKIRDRVAQARAEMRAQQEAHAGQVAELDASITAREQKLEHLDRAIKNKSGELGSAIARELI